MASASLNKVQLIGNVGNDPEIRYTQGGDGVATLSIATSETWTNKTNNNKETRVEWHSLVCYRNQAEFVRQYISKGRQIFVEGRIHSHKYTGKDNVERTSYEIIVSNILLLGSNPNSPKTDGLSSQNSASDASAENTADADIEPSKLDSSKGRKK